MPSSDRPAVLVTGGAGYIGCHAAEALARNGFMPVAYDSLERGSESLVRFGPIEVGDIRDEVRLRQAIERHRPVAIMHFAALALVAESVERPALYEDVNVGGARCVFRVALDAGIRHVVFSSTCAVYGVPAEQPIHESTPKAPINPYGRSKLMAEQVLADLAAAEGLRYTALRYFNACGAHPAAEIGELHDPEPHLIPRILMAAGGSIDAVEVMGIDYPTPDGTAIRDYVHVCDVADAHLAALRYLQGNGAPVALNIGTGRGHSVLEVLAAAKRVTGRDIPVRHASRRPGDPPVLTADVTASRQVLGFAAKWLDMEEIIRTAWAFQQKQESGSAAG